MIHQVGEVRARLIALLGDLLGPSVALPEPFPMERQLSDLGVSSLKMVNLMLAVETAFGIEIPQADITPDNFHSVEAIERLVTRTLERGVAA